MKFTKYDLGNLKKGQTIVVALSGSAANVRLMDSSNLNAYKNGRKHKYYGGLAKRSPARIAVPHNGHWYLTIDLMGLKGKVTSSVSIEAAPLPEIRHSNSLSSIPSLIRDTAIITPTDSGKIFDVFISHASEDKNAVARPLAKALSEAGLDVWFDEFEMRIGDSLRRKIDQGLAHSRFGIVVISRDFINKGWTNYELDGILTKTISGEQMMLPIWHNITKDEVISYSPTLADKIARNTATDSIEDIAAEISDLIKSAE